MKADKVANRMKRRFSKYNESMVEFHTMVY